MTEIDFTDELTAAMAELASLLVDEDDLPGMLDRVARLAVRSIPDCDSAGVTLVAGDEPMTAAATDRRTLAVDIAQYKVGDGPCLEAYRTRIVQRVRVQEAIERYPEFAMAAAEAGVKSFLAAPLLVRSEGIGSLNLYSTEPHGFEALDEAVVVLFAGQAAVAVANSRMYQSAKALSAQLETAMASRAVIEQAKGVVMAVRSVNADQAFDLLRRTSQAENRKLRQIAMDVVAAAAAGRPVSLRV
ncbi:MAG TPA: GAF and ANTAR domain-containing protein [Pseudonocardiaceae bacterium]